MGWSSVRDRVFALRRGGRVDRSQPLNFSFNGQTYQGFAGDTLAAALLFDRAQAEDVVHEVFVKLVQNRDTRAGFDAADKVVPRIVAASYNYRYFPTTRGWAEMMRLGDLPQYVNAGVEVQRASG